MSLADEYAAQSAWRAWPAAIATLPPLEGRRVLDLGCGPGAQAALLCARGARVIGFDAHAGLIEEARARRIAGAEFHLADLRALPDSAQDADGIWCSFAAAYLTDLRPVLEAWSRRLRPGGWMALAEVDDLFAHEPLGERTRELLEAYADEALAAGRYDFRMGRRLARELREAGLEVALESSLSDGEFSFQGPATPAVLGAWDRRLERMLGLQRFCGAGFADLRRDFLAALAHGEHRSASRVCWCVAGTGLSGAS